MAYPVNALSFGPLSGQVHITSKNEQQKGIPYTISYTHDDAPPPNLNNVAGGVTANSSEQRDHDQSTDTAISKAFAAASLVLEGQDKAETVFVWQPTVHHNPEHVSPPYLLDDISDRPY